MSNNNNTPPPWSEAPPWAMWRAQDYNGDWYAFDMEPEKNEDAWWWWTHNNLYALLLETHIVNPNWRDTLQKRPENE